MRKIITMMVLAMSFSTIGFAQKAKTATKLTPAATEADSIKTIFDKAKQGNAAAQNQVGAWYYSGKYVKQDYQQAYDWWKKSALQGNVDGIGNLALCYQFGRGVEKDSIDAIRLYMKSIKEGNTRLLDDRTKRAETTPFDGVLMGLCYQKGNGVGKDSKKALEFFSKAARLNSVDGARELALCYMNNKDAKSAAPWFKRAAAQNDLSSIYYYGKLLLDGNGVGKDVQNAAIYLLKAAEKGFPQAQTEVGNLYSTGTGVAKNEESAVLWYKKAAANKNVHGMWNFAVCLMKGIGIQRDYDAALFWFGEASVGGYQRAFNKMIAENEEVKKSAFVNYLKGMKAYMADKKYDEAMKAFKLVEKAKAIEGKTMQGVIFANNDYSKKNVKKAVKLLKACSETNPIAAFYLATLYENGKGVEKDMQKAIELYTKSADAGYGTAQSYLGDIYYEGRGIEQNYTKAVEYYLNAYNQLQLTVNSTKRLAACYENGWGGLNVDKQKASELQKEQKVNNAKALLQTLEF